MSAAHQLGPSQMLKNWSSQPSIPYLTETNNQLRIVFLRAAC
jgi:hypothetical protein